jgi:hypothetical protein
MVWFLNRRKQRPDVRKRGSESRPHRTIRLEVEQLEERTLPSASPIGDVFVILMENHNWTQPASYTGTPHIEGSASAPYINNTLTQIGAYANNYENAALGDHPSEPNYIWLEAGTNFGMSTDADPGHGSVPASPYSPNGTNLYTAPSFTQQLDQAGIFWKSYQEDLDINTTNGEVLPQSQWTSGITSSSGTTSNGDQYNYAVKHNPDEFFSYNIGATAANGYTPQANDPFGIAHNQPLQQFYQDLLTGKVGKFNYITPDQYNDMHSLRNGSTDLIAQGDNWLAQNIPLIMASQAYKNNGVIMVVWDETEGGDTSQFTVPFFLISPLAKAGYSNNTLYTHSSTLKTLEEIEGVGQLSDASQTGYFNANDLSGLFQPGVLTPSTLSGKVFIDLHDLGSFENGDPGVSGLTVHLTGTNEVGQKINLTTTTNYEGAYSFAGLLPGTYTISITPPLGLRNDFTTPTGQRTDITLGADQMISDLDFGLLLPGPHQHGGHHQGEGHNH